MSRKSLRGVMPVGTEGVCGHPGLCAMANHLRAEHGVTRPNVGLETIRFRLGGLNYVIPTPRNLRTFIYGFDRTAVGATETVLEPVPYSLPLDGPSVRITEPKPMTEESRRELQEATKRRAKDTVGERARRARQRQLKARVS